MNIRMNRKMKNKVLASIVTLVVLALLAVVASVAEPQSTMASGVWDGSGTQTSPYMIADAADLAALATGVNNGNGYAGTYFVLMGDIDLSTDYSAGWVPIGNSSNGFSGIFDGKGQTVTGMYINTTAAYNGLFGRLGSGGEIINLNIDGANVTGGNDTGGIVGDNWGRVMNCSVTGSVNGNNYVGGAVGYNENGSVVANCCNACTVTSSSVNVGGVAGYNYGIVTNCHNTGNVKSTYTSLLYVGGVVGQNSGGKVEGSYNTGTVSGSTTSSYVGGIVGSNSGPVKNCYNTGTVSGIGEIGGVIGNNYNALTNCYNVGIVNFGGTGYAGGVVGYSVGGSSTVVSACFFDSSVNSTLDGTGRPYLSADPNGDTAPETSAWMKVQSNFEGAGWDFNNIWTIDSGNNSGYPTLIGYAVPDEAVEIYTFDDLMHINTNPVTLCSSYILKNDIVFTDENNAVFTPIGPDINNKFIGTFDGDGYTISGISINVTAAAGYNSYAGLFGYAAYATICNIGVEDSDITSSAYAGGIVGNAFPYVTITNCHYSGSVNAETYAGGIAGLADGIIENCYNTGTITAVSPDNQSYAGGIVGQMQGSIKNCYNTGKITATSQNSMSGAGGIAGTVFPQYSSPMVAAEGCYNTGDIIAAAPSNGANAGGIAGIASSLAVKDCYNTGHVEATGYYSAYAGGIFGNASSLTMENCYNTNSVAADATSTAEGDGGHSLSQEYAGGIVGSAYGVTISYCYFLEGTSNTIGHTDSPPLVDDGSDISSGQESGAKTESEMKPTLEDARGGHSIYYTGTGGWDFTNVWSIDSNTNGGYPHFGDAAPENKDIVLTGKNVILEDTTFDYPGFDKVTIMLGPGASLEVGQAADPDNGIDGISAILTVPGKTTIVVPDNGSRYEVVNGMAVYDTKPAAGSEPIADALVIGDKYIYTDIATALDISVSGDIVELCRNAYLFRDATVKSGVTFDSAGYELTVDEKDILFVNGTLNAKNIVLNGTMFIYGTVNFDGGIVTLNGSIDVASGGTLNVTNDASISQPDNSGVIEVDGIADFDGYSVEVSMFVIGTGTASINSNFSVTKDMQVGAWPVISTDHTNNATVNGSVTLVDDAVAIVYGTKDISSNLTNDTISVNCMIDSALFAMIYCDSGYNVQIPLLDEPQLMDIAITDWSSDPNIYDDTTSLAKVSPNFGDSGWENIYAVYDKNTCAVTFTPNPYIVWKVNGSTLSDGTYTAYYGEEITVTADVQPGCEGTPIIKVNSVAYTEGAAYAVVNDATFTATGVWQLPGYTVTLTPGEGYVLTPYGSSASPVAPGGSYSFTLSAQPGYDISGAVVIVNATSPISPIGGIYIISPMTRDVTVTVTGVVSSHTAIPGDLDGDGVLSNIDVMMLMTYLAGGDVTIDPSLADMNGDGQVNNIDIMLMMTIIAGG